MIITNTTTPCTLVLNRTGEEYSICGVVRAHSKVVMTCYHLKDSKGYDHYLPIEPSTEYTFVGELRRTGATTRYADALMSEMLVKGKPITITYLNSKFSERHYKIDSRDSVDELLAIVKSRFKHEFDLELRVAPIPIIYFKSIGARPISKSIDSNYIDRIRSKHIEASGAIQALFNDGEWRCDDLQFIKNRLDREHPNFKYKVEGNIILRAK